MQAIVDEHILTEILEKDYKEHGEKVSPLRIPKDKYLLCHLVFFLLGIAHFLPMSFLNAAMNFWMYKFRNLSDPTMSTGNRTTLQTHFASSQMIANTVPMFLLGLWNMIYGPRYKIMSRVNITLVLEVLVYYLITAFVKINTDDYQGAFFAFILISWAVLTGGNIVNVVACSLLYPRFPHSYMKTSMIGEGVAGIVGDALNIVSVAAFDDVSDATLMYFIFGSAVVTITLILTVIISKNEFFQHCIQTMPQDQKAKMPPRKEVFSILLKIRLTLILSVLMAIGMAASHTSVTSLVVSEQDTSTSTWANKFFTPVLTFFWTDCCGLVGRFLASHSPLQKLPDFAIYIIGLVRTVVFVPLLWFCNAQPRSHLSVLFPHDYQYAIIIGLFMMINGYLMNMTMLMIPRKTTREEAEVAFTVFSFLMGILNTATSPIGMFAVDII